MSLSDQIGTAPQYLLPKRLLTATVYRLTRLRSPWLKNTLIKGFIKLYNVDMTIAANADPHSYSDFNAFFTRALRADARPIDPANDSLCCPVDGFVSQVGRINNDNVIQAKGRNYSLTQLLGGDPERAAPFRNGHFATLYLSPRDYHRIHMPLDGRLQEMAHIPGTLFSVSPLTTRVIPNLFARNERVVTMFKTAAGPMAMVLVGAVNVASIETIWAGSITPPLAKTIRHWTYPEIGPDAINLAKGVEMGRFNMGSTVILVFTEDAVEWDASIRPDARIQMGQRLGEHSNATPISAYALG